jgi:hypothetical protein
MFCGFGVADRAGDSRVPVIEDVEEGGVEFALVSCATLWKRFAMGRP